MFLTNDQNYLLSVLDTTVFMGTKQVSRLLRLLDTDKNERYAAGVLRQLRYMGKVVFPADNIISLPDSGPCDGEMLDAIDVMLDMTEGQILAVNTKNPFKLCFLTEHAESAGNFAVLTVPKGKEKQIGMLLSETEKNMMTVILLLSDSEQKNRIHAAAPYYFAVRADTGRYRYYKG